MSSNSPVDTFKGASKWDQGVLATGVLGFIASFFPWYGIKSVTVEGFGTVGGGSISAWHSYSTLAVLLLLASTIIAAGVIFAKSSMPNLPVGSAWVVAGLSVLAAFLEALRMATLHHGDGLAIKWGGWVLLILMIANAVFAVLAATNSGQAAPWDNRSGDASPPPPAPPAA
jgi:ABC-type multidrug transport system permease subunit